MTTTIPARDWELTCHECDGSGHVYVKRQVAERKTDMQEFKEECECCEGRGFVFAFQDIPGIEEYVKTCSPAPAAAGVSTVEDAPAAYLTLDEEGSPCMLFFDVAEARGYCALGEEPEALYRRPAPAAGDALDARQLMALADAVVVQWQREDKMPQMAWGFREFLVAGMQALIDSNRAPHGGDGLVDSLARLAYYYAVELESATRNADSDRLEEIARSITAKLKGEIRAAIAAQRKGDA